MSECFRYVQTTLCCADECPRAYPSSAASEEDGFELADGEVRLSSDVSLGFLNTRRVDHVDRFNAVMHASRLDSTSTRCSSLAV